MKVKEKKKKYAKDIDKARKTDSKIKKKKKKETADKRERSKIKKTTLQTIPYECFVSNYIMLNRSNVKIGKITANLYSKCYYVPDFNYHVLTEEEQLEKIKCFVDIINSFDENIGVQLSIVQNDMSDKTYKSLMVPFKDDDYKKMRKEYNDVFESEVSKLQTERYMTITIPAANVEKATSKFFNLEAQLISGFRLLGTEIKSLNANERIRLLADIFRGENEEFSEISQAEFARQEEKCLCSPDYFEFCKDYFMFNEKYARCMYMRRLPASVSDTIYKDIIDLGFNMIITENIEFVDPQEAITLLKRKITDMKQETIAKVKKASEYTGGGVDPIEGTQLAIDQSHAQEFLDDLQHRGQKMTMVQFIIMFTAENYEDLQRITDSINMVLRRHQIISANSPYRQEQSMSSALPIGNSLSVDKDNNLQIRRTLSSESTAIFTPFCSIKILHENGIWYGKNRINHSPFIFNRRSLLNPNGFIFGMPGAGKSFTANLEIINALLSSDEEVIIIDPEGEYIDLAKLFNGEVIKISPNSKTHINPLDLTENPDKDDNEYDPVKAKLDFLLSFFSAILGNKELSPVQQTIIDDVMRATYEKHKSPTFKEFYHELEKYEADIDAVTIEEEATYLRQTLKLYVYGSMNVFSQDSNIDIHKRFIVYDIKELGKNLQTVGMNIVLENVWDRVAKNRVLGKGTRIYVDEMYLMFKSAESANFFFELFKRARKWGGVPTGLTQNVDDLLRSERACTMIENTEFVVILPQNASDKRKLANLLKIPDDTMELVNSSGHGGLIYCGRKYGVVPYENNFPVNNDIYKAITTKFNEKIGDN